MKRIISFILKAAILIQALTFGACAPEIAEEAAEGLVIKSFMPVAVMPGCEMSITGNGFEDVVSVVFPDGIEVTDFKIVTDNLINVIVPSGIVQEGGKLIVVTPDGKAESHVSMRPARPVVKSLDPGDEIKPGKTLTIKGEDMEYVTEVIFPGKEEGETVSVQSMDFLRKSPDNVKVIVPDGIFNGIAALSVKIADGRSLTTPEITLTSGPSADDNYIFCTIKSAAVDRYITRNPSATTPIIQDRTGGKDQEFVFIPVDGEYGTYYLKNVGSEEYLSIGSEYEWRMGWYADPSEAPKPENAKFQVFPLEGTDGYYRIHVLGSIDLGLDSTGDWSEVYSNKSDKSNPYYQWVINKTSGPDFADPNAAPPVEEGPKVLWEGAQEPDPDDSGWVNLYLTSEELTGLSVGSILRMYFTPTEGQWQQLDYRDGNDGAVAGYECAGMDGFPTFADGYIDLEVTQELFDRISVTGISFRGFWFTITKIELIGGGQTPPTPPVESSNILFEGAQEPDPNDNGWVNLHIGADKLGNLAVGHILRMHFTPTEGQWQQLDYRDGNDGAIAGYEWAGMDGFPTFADGYIDLEVTQDIYDRISATGISFRGFWFTITKVEIIGEIVTPPATGDENFIWEGSKHLSWDGMGDLSWGGYDWTTVTAGTILTAYYELDSDQTYWQIVFAKADGWKPLPSSEAIVEGGVIGLEAGSDKYEFTLTEDDVNDLINGQGLVINGTNFTLTGLSLK